jgi:hypothetical protein
VAADRTASHEPRGLGPAPVDSLRADLMHRRLRERMFGEPTVRARFEIFASRIPTRLARPLKVASGTPALTFVRRYFGASGENFENSVTVHPELRFTYTMDVQREPRKPRRT